MNGRVLLCTEGTYPFAGGGVSTWCDILCSELSEYDFTVCALTGAPEARLRYQLPPNVSAMLQVPLWGVSGPEERLLAGEPARIQRMRRRRSGPDAIQSGFLPLLDRLLGGLASALSAGEGAADDGARIVAGDGIAAPRAPEGAPDGGAQDVELAFDLWRFFADHDWRGCWKSPQAWELFATRFAHERDASVDDLSDAYEWLYHYLMPLAAPLPEVDLVHTTIAGVPGLLGAVAKQARGTPLLITEHGVWLRERYIAVSASGLSPFLKRFLMGLSRFVAAIDYACADVVAPVTDFNVRWERPCGVPQERLHTVRNGVDPALFAPRPRPGRSARPTVVAAARVYPLKDMETMIRAAAVAREAIPDVRFLVYGSLDADVPYVGRCRELIAQLSLEESFELAGHHPQPSRLYAEGDVCALSSISEAFPYTVLEAMSCAKPVVATDVGGVREALEGFGVVVAPRDHEALGCAIVTLLNDDLLRAQMGRQAREAVLARYRIAYSVSAYRELYARLLEGRDQ